MMEGETTWREKPVEGSNHMEEETSWRDEEA